MFQVGNAHADDKAEHDKVNATYNGIGQCHEESCEFAEEAEDEEDEGGGLDHSSGSAAGDGKR